MQRDLKVVSVPRLAGMPLDDDEEAALAAEGSLPCLPQDGRKGLTSGAEAPCVRSGFTARLRACPDEGTR
jgi:hypothetical protein